jgi:hypothetical protein
MADATLPSEDAGSSESDSGPSSLEEANVKSESGTSDSGGTSKQVDGGTGDAGSPPPDDGGVAIDPALVSKCSGTNPIACHFGGSIGNYDVTVELGGPTAGDTSVMAEISREMLAPVVTTAGETAKYTMVVNVRSPEGQPVADLTGAGERPSGLDLCTSGATMRRDSPLERDRIRPRDDPVVVYLATDSTGCDQFDTAYAGWGQWLPQYFGRPLSIANYGNSGVDTPGFASGSHYWPDHRGAHHRRRTYLLIELGDNDKSDSAASITQGLTTMIAREPGRKGRRPSS